MHTKLVRIFFVFRVILWVTATAATYYWIAWSFKLYNMGYFDVHEYSGYLRPILAKGLLIAFVCICMSLILRSVSDRIKKKEKEERYKVN